MNIKELAEVGMTLTWWLYVGSFLISLAIIIMGMLQGNFVFVAIGLVIGIGLYFNRSRIQ